MLEKLAAIADVADQQGYHEAASDITQLIKTAQLFDALKTLFDPSSSELDLNSGFWKRLTRGWQRGKFDRRLGLALAINAERTKLNKKIEQLAAPLKEFSNQVSAFYDKVRSGGDDYGAMDFKEELSRLKSDASKMKNLIGGKDLRRALDMRNKLNVEQISAVEKIKGIDPEHKDFLVKLLNGEIKGEAQQSSKQDVPGAVQQSGTGVQPAMGFSEKRDEQQKPVKDWLKLQKLPRLDYEEGFTTPRSRQRALQFYSRYGFNPMVVEDFFKNNKDKKEELLEQVGKKVFGDFFKDVNWTFEIEKEQKAKEQQKAVAPAKPAEVIVPAEVAKEKAKEMPMPSGPPPIPADAPAKKLDDTAVTLKMLKDLERGEKELAEKRKSKTKPEEKTQREVETIPMSPASDLAFSTASRVSREITRLGRMHTLKKIADDMQNDEDLLDILDPLDRMGDEQDKAALIKHHEDELQKAQQAFDNMVNNNHEQRREMWKAYLAGRISDLQGKIKLLEGGVLPPDEE